MKISTKTIVMVGMFTAVISVLSILTIPMPSGVPVTMQTFAMALCGYVLGSKRGPVTAFVYLLLGAVGVPVYAGMSAGPAVLFGYSGGFLWGFIFMAMLCGIGMKQKNAGLRLFFGLAGLLACHLFGVVQFAIVTKSTLATAFAMSSMPFLIKDILSTAGAYFVAVPVRKALTAGNLLEEKSVGRTA